MKKTIQGLGINFFQESVGAVNRVGGGVNYSFHYPITNTLSLASGIGVLIDNTKINLDKLYFGINGVNPDPFYQKLFANGSNHTELNIRAGVLLYSPRYYVGISYYPTLYTHR